MKNKNKNRKVWIIVVAIAVVLLAATIGYFLYEKNKVNIADSSEDNYQADRTSTSENIQNETNTSSSETPAPTPTPTENVAPSNVASPTPSTPPPAPKEEQLSTYTTKIYSNDTARQNNISITCKTLNGTTVKKGTTFSFCNTVGQASSSKGYQKADVLDKNGKKKKGLGGRKLSN